MKAHVIAAAVIGLPGLASAQQPTRATPVTDSLRLSAVHAQARQADPRLRQLTLSAQQSALRMQTIDASRRPSLALDGTAQYQSDVVRIPFQLPTGQTPPASPHDTYDAHLLAQLPLVDPTLTPRRAVERAQLAENEAQVLATLFTRRQEVDEAFFTTAELQARAAELAAAIADLEARLRDAAARVRNGVSLRSDTSAIQATILQRRQDEGELLANRRAALERLSNLMGRVVSDSEPIALPDLAARVDSARRALGAVRSRPEYQVFATTRDLLARQADATAAQERPRVSAFGRAGYGRPGLNMLSSDFETYWVGGLQVQWTPWTWGTPQREREVLALQREIVATNEAAFSQTLERSTAADFAAVDRLAEALETDDRIVALRAQVDAETRTRLGEGVVTAAEYMDRNTELVQARLARARHRVELAQARAHVLTTLGLEVP